MKKPIRPVHGKEHNYERVLDRTHDILNGGVDIGGLNNPGNLNNIHVLVQTPGVVNTDFTVIHNLGRIPQAARISRSSGLCNIWAGSVLWTTKTVTLQADHINVFLTIEIY